MKNIPYYIKAMGILTIALVASGVLFFLSANVEGDEVRFRTGEAQEIYGLLQSQLVQPALVSRTMAGDVFLQEYLAREEELSKSTVSGQLASYLGEMQSRGDYLIAYVISKKTNRFYSENGSERTMDYGEGTDLWLREFWESGEDFAVETMNLEQRDSQEVLLFISRMEDANGTPLGVCGIGILASKLQEQMASLEEQYEIRLDYIDEEKLIHLDSVDTLIRTGYLPDVDLPEQSGGESFSQKSNYQKYGLDGYAVSCFVPELGWYFVLRKEDASAPLYWERYLWGGILIWALAMWLLYLSRDKARMEAHRNGKQSDIDVLTGLPNRNYFKQTYGERGVFNTTRYQSIAVFDIDFFKEANDSLNGDEILQSVVLRGKEMVGNRGIIFRWGGDEFMMLLEMTVDDAYERCRGFVRDVEKAGRVTISLGLTEVRISDTIKKNYYRAAQNCYLAKEMGGNAVKKG